VQLYPENQIFWNTIFRPPGGAAPQNFYTCYRMSVMLAYTPPGMGAPPTIFFPKGVKNWLIIQHISVYNFGVRGSNPMRLCHMTGHKGNIITYIQHLGGPAPLKFGKAKNV